MEGVRTERAGLNPHTARNVRCVCVCVCVPNSGESVTRVGCGMVAPPPGRTHAHTHRRREEREEGRARGSPGEKMRARAAGRHPAGALARLASPHRSRSTHGCTGAVARRSRRASPRVRPGTACTQRERRRRRSLPRARRRSSLPPALTPRSLSPPTALTCSRRPAPRFAMAGKEEGEGVRQRAGRDRHRQACADRRACVRWRKDAQAEGEARSLPLTQEGACGAWVVLGRGRVDTRAGHRRTRGRTRKEIWARPR